VEELRTTSRCILLFARAADEEARVKRLSHARGVFALARRRVVAAASALSGVDLLTVEPGVRRAVPAPLAHPLANRPPPPSSELIVTRVS